MEFKTVGGDGGLRVSAISIGCNAFGARCDEAQTASIVHQAIESGINFFDTANTYGDGRSEEFIGTALGARRGDVIVATKFGMRDGGSISRTRRRPSRRRSKLLMGWFATARCGSSAARTSPAAS
jgi:aryl-alcohol dehydrogenase-like predicted oxidoreductase